MVNDLDRYPLFYYHPTLKLILPYMEGLFLPFIEEDFIKGKKWNWHHFVEKKFLKRNPERAEELLKHQKMILMQENMNMDIEKRTAGFKRRWSIELREVVYLDD